MRLIIKYLKIIKKRKNNIIIWIIWKILMKILKITIIKKMKIAIFMIRIMIKFQAFKEEIAVVDK